jgi:8-oxo-dGTP pyrophosphatase MutT (NUDIX family)
VITISQAGVLAVRSDAQGHVQVLLVTSRKRGRWTIPKGVVGLRLDSRSTARIEAREEAGVSGRISREPVGTYTYRKWHSKCRVRVYAMQVTAQDADWPERELRKRKWFRARDAVEAIARKRLRRLVKDALAHLPKDARKASGAGPSPVRRTAREAARTQR